MPIDEAKKVLRNLFERAKAPQPSIVFIDEVDSLCPKQKVHQEMDHSSRIKYELIVLMESIYSKAQQGVIVLAASSIPWVIDSAFR